MTQKDFAVKFLKGTQAHWSQVLRGHRNLGYKRARTVASLLDTNIDLWINPQARANERLSAWKSFKKRLNK